mgnify:CR=1
MASPADGCKFQALLFSIMEIKNFDEFFEKNTIWWLLVLADVLE